MSKIELTLESAARFIESGNSLAAIRTLKETLSQDPEHPEAHALMALALFDQKRLVAAEFETASALRFDPENSLAGLIQIQLFIAGRKFKEAETALLHQKTLHGNNPDLLEIESKIYLLKGDSTTASHLLTEALEKDPENPGLLTELGQIEFQRGHYEKASRFINEALSLNPEGPEPLIIKGHLLLVEGKTEEAKEHALWALSMSPGNEGAITLLCAIKSKKNPLMGIWWNWNHWMQTFGEVGMVAILLGAFLLYKTLTIALIQFDRMAHAQTLSWVWLAFCLYTWLAPSFFEKMVKKEIEGVNLRNDF